MQELNFMLELQKMFLEAAKKSGFSVVLLIAGMYGMFSIGSAQLEEVKGELKATDKKLEDAYLEIRKCDAERASLEARVEWLLDRLQNRFPDLKKRPYVER